MMKISLYLRLSALICGSFASTATAAPPAITHLYPAGAQRGTTTEVTAAGTLDATTKVWVSGVGVSAEVAKGKFAVTVAKDATPGTYWLRAHNAEGASALRPFVVGVLPEVTEKEPNDDFKKPHVLNDLAVTINGRLEKSGDVDCFAVPLKKGQTLVASLQANRVLNSPMDGMLQILSADGFVVEENNDFHGLDPQLAFTAKKDGTYIARVYAFPAAPDASIRYFGSDACVYRLTLTTGAFADFALPVREPDAPPQADIWGWNLPKSGKRLLVPKLAPGEAFAALSDPEIANPVPLRVEPHPHFVDVDQRDRLAHKYEAPFSLTARLHAKGLAQRIPLSLKKGQALTLQVESRTLGLAVNPVIEVFDKDEKRVARAEPAKLNGDSVLSFNPPADGAYSIAVSDLYGGGGGARDVFALRVLEAKPDYDLTVAADRFTLTPGTPTTIPVKINRQNEFAKNVEISAEGLPEGVKLEAAKPAKAQAGVLTVSLTAEKPWSGSFRLIGTIKGEPKYQRTARFALTESDDTTADLWLTVTAPPKK
ncbi:PPC domain-containing protein [Gemmata sp. G18]|uniref:PPC domain-containing protein n=1 Tax=Gemmata palustris TaxID=2822762 RepID=A0ABS5BW37_9BACT|nr:PPC domain-containing protein [Gemmata palustris]MBP3957103.1 PPC domain-containing protein [Gemmata palustris]